MNECAAMGVAMKYENLLNTDPLAIFALGGLAVTVLVSVTLFAWLMTRKDRKA